MIIGIVDDNKYDQRYLIDTIEEWCQHKDITFDIQCFNNGEEFLKEYEKDKFKLVFMDIYMNKINGIEVVNKIRQTDSRLLFVFLTTSKEHVFEAIPLHIFDYIQKPYSKDRLFHVLDEIYKFIPQANKMIEFNSGKQHVCLNLSDILYISSSKNFTSFTIKDEELRYRITFSKIKDLIDDDRFLFCMRGTLVNMDYIIRQEKDYFIMINKHKVYIRRNEKKELIKIYENYQFKKLDNI